MVNVPYTVLYESVVNGGVNAGAGIAMGANNNFNNSGNEFTVIAAFQEVITSITLIPGAGNGGPGGADAAVIAFKLLPGGNNFFNMYANAPGTANPSTGNGAGFALGTQILSGSITSANFGGSFMESGTISGTTFIPQTAAFNQSPYGSAIATGLSVVGGGGTQITVGINSANAGYFVTNGLTQFLFSTTSSLPFAASAPLSGFYSSPGASPNVTYPGTPPGGFDPGSINGENGNSLMFQTVATNGFGVAIIPEPSSAVIAVSGAVTGIAIALVRKRRARRRIHA
jgi:hypothetical protein